MAEPMVIAAARLRAALVEIEREAPGVGAFLEARAKLPGGMRLTGLPRRRPVEWLVEVAGLDGWVEVCRIPWERLGDDLGAVRAAMRDGVDPC